MSKYFPLIWAGLSRKPVRTALTTFSIVVAFFLFGLLQGVDAAFTMLLEDQQLDRLFVDPRFERPLPLSYATEIRRLKEVQRLAPVAFLGGSYKDPRNSILMVGTSPTHWLAIRPEFQVDPDQLQGMTKVRSGALVSQWLATKNGWQVGDIFTIQAGSSRRDGGADWQFQVVGIFRHPKVDGEVRYFLANLDYFDAGRAAADQGTVHRFLLKISDGRKSAQMARRIDDLFASSSVPTKTQSEHAAAQSHVASIGNIALFAKSITAAVLFTLLLLTSNTISESVRERTREFAVLRTLGFNGFALIGLVFGESLLLCFAGALAGLAAAAVLFPSLESFVEVGTLPLVVLFYGTTCAVALALISTLFPLWYAVRLSIVDALGRQ